VCELWYISEGIIACSRRMIFNLWISEDVNEMSFNTHALEVPITVVCVQVVA